MTLLTPDFLQTKKYTAKAVRNVFDDLGELQAGVYKGTSLKVVQNPVGASMVVAVSEGGAWVDGTATTRQGRYHVYNDGTVNLTIAPNGTANPRIDQVVVRVNDTIHGAGVADSVTFEVVQGVATSGATLDNRSGAAGIPTSCLRLCDIVVGAGVSSITTANIRDRRKWARGIFWHSTRTSSNITFSNTTNTVVDASAMQARFECAGNPIRLTATVAATAGAAALSFMFLLDGVAAEGVGTRYSIAAGATQYATFSQTITPAAGSHSIGLGGRVASGSGTIIATADTPLALTVEEIISQNTSNS